MVASRFAELLRRHRLTAGWTQEELAERARLSVRAISDLERGLKQSPRQSTVRLLAQALSLDDTATSILVTAALDRSSASDLPLAWPNGTADGAATRQRLPARVSTFVGRVREVADVSNALSRARLVTLTGAGGIGKTRLAEEVARSVQDHFADGVWLVDLSSLADQALVPQTMAQTLGLRDGRARRAEGLVELLHEQNALLVLDNCEHVVGACAELADALVLGCPRLHLLATSREPLGVDGEVVWRVPPLSVPSGRPPFRPEEIQDFGAVALFVARATAAQPGFALTDRNAGGVVEICRRLDGLPLALELAAARIRVLSAEQIAARLDDRFQLLTASTRTAVARHYTLRAAIAWSYDQLSAAEQALLERLAVFAGSFDFEAVQAVAAASDELPSGIPLLDLLGRLLDKSLVLAEPSPEGDVRYRLLESVREFAQEKLVARPIVAAARDAHAAYFLALAEQAEPALRGPLYGEWLDRLEREHDNMRVALRWFLDRRDAARGLRLGAALRRFWWTRGFVGEGRTLLEELLALPSNERSPARARVLNGCGMLAQFDNAASRSFYEEGLALALEVGDLAEAGWAQYRLGESARWLGDLGRARQLLEQAVASCHAAADRQAESLALGGLCSLALDEGDLATAEALGESALAIARETGWARAIILSEGRLATVLMLARRHQRARQLNEHSLALAVEVGAEPLAYAQRNYLAELEIRQNDLTRAGFLLMESVAQHRNLEPTSLFAGVLELAALRAGAAGQAQVALRLLGAAAALSERLGDPPPTYRRALLEALDTSARRALGDERAAAAVAAGRALSRAEIRAELIASLTEAPPTAASSRRRPDDLSARELDVLRSVALGKDNAQIAEELVLSVRTVERHLSNIYAKLGVSGKAARAAAVAEVLRERTHRG